MTDFLSNLMKSLRNLSHRRERRGVWTSAKCNWAEQSNRAHGRQVHLSLDLQPSAFTHFRYEPRKLASVSIYKHYFRYNEEPTSVRGPSSCFVSTDRGKEQRHAAHGRRRAEVATQLSSDAHADNPMEHLSKTPSPSRLKSLFLKNIILIYHNWFFMIIIRTVVEVLKKTTV
jgi:hypothetical protein